MKFTDDERFQEILGYFHNTLSQHTNDLTILAKRINQIDKQNDPNNSTNYDTIIDAINVRLESFAASINSLTTQFLNHEKTVSSALEKINNQISSTNEKILKLENRMDALESLKGIYNIHMSEDFHKELQHQQDIFDEELSQVRQQIKSISEKTSSKKSSSKLSARSRSPSRIKENPSNQDISLVIDQKKISDLISESSTLKSIIQRQAEEFHIFKRTILDNTGKISHSTNEALAKAQQATTNIKKMNEQLPCFVTHQELSQYFQDHMRVPQQQSVTQFCQIIDGDNLRRPRPPRYVSQNNAPPPTSVRIKVNRPIA